MKIKHDTPELWDTTKAVLRRKFIAIHAYVNFFLFESRSELYNLRN